MSSPIRTVRKIAGNLKKARADHVTRHRPTGFRFAIADDVRFLNPQDWDAAAGGGGFLMSRPYQQLLADHGPENLSPRYALIYRDEKPVAAVAAQIVTIEGNRLVKSQPATAARGKEETKKSLLKRALAPLGKKAVASLEERVLICGNLLSWGRHGVAFADGESPAELWPAVTEALYRIRRGEKLLGDTALLVIKDLSPADLPDAEVLKTYSYRPADTDPDMVLEVAPEWKNHGDYLASLDRKYRKSVTQIFTEAEKAGVTLEQVDDVAAHGEALHALYLQVHLGATVRPVTLTPSFLPELARTAGAGFRCTVARREGRIVGFITTLKDGDTAIGYYIGYDRETAAQGVPLYLRLLHRTIEDTIALGCKRLSLGRTALEPKARLGAKPVPLHLWTRHRVPALNLVLRRLLSAVPHDEAPERNPFKKGQAAEG